MENNETNLSLDDIKNAMNIEDNDKESSPIPSDGSNDIENKDTPSKEENSFEHLLEEDDSKEEKREKKKRRYTQTERETIARERQERERLKNELQNTYYTMESLQAQLIQEKSARLDAEEERLGLLESHYDELKSIALEEGDYRTPTKVDKELRAIQNQREKIAHEREMYLQQLRAPQNNYQNNYQHQQNYDYNQQTEPQFSEADHNYNDWVDSHPYLQRGSPNYSPQLESLASQISSQLDVRYKINARGEEIGSKRYFDELTHLMNENINSMMGRHVPDTGYKSQSRYVSPVNSSMNTFSGGNYSSKPKLNSEEVDMINRFGRAFGGKDDIARTYLKSKINR